MTSLLDITWIHCNGSCFYGVVLGDILWVDSATEGWPFGKVGSLDMLDILSTIIVPYINPVLRYKSLLAPYSAYMLARDFS